ncbi:MAG: CHASE2 domain-containing protein, partial [bacterium]
MLLKKKFARGVLVSCAAFLIILVLHSLHLFHPLEWKSWDLRLHLFSNPSRASRDIVLFLIDQYSLDIYEKQQALPWPWPRELYAYIIQYCKAGGARACIFDLIFSEVSRYG